MKFRFLDIKDLRCQNTNLNKIHKDSTTDIMDTLGKRQSILTVWLKMCCSKNAKNALGML